MNSQSDVDWIDYKHHRIYHAFLCFKGELKTVLPYPVTISKDQEALDMDIDGDDLIVSYECAILVIKINGQA